MTNIQNILVPHAGPESADRALELAVNITKTVAEAKST